MNITTQTHLTDQQKEAALNIWNTEYPVRLHMSAMVDFEAFLAQLTDPKYYLMLAGDDVVAGWAATFTAGPVRSFFIMFNRTYHSKGYGTILLNELKKEGPQLFAWAIDHNDDIKADGRPYSSPINFYLKNGFTVNNELRLENEQLSAVNILWERTAPTAGLSS